MDSRNITEPTPTIEDGRYLEKIYELQKVLVDHYVNIEGLPPYPVNVNTKESQVLLKDFTGRVIEELAEGYESQFRVQKIAEFQGYFYKNMDESTKIKEFRAMANHVQNINEELADSLHFMVELLIYCNIQPDDIENYIRYQIVKTIPIPIASSNGDVLAYVMVVGKHLISASLENVRCYDMKFNSLSHIWDKDYTPIGYHTSPGFIEEISKALWDITYSLNISRNCLKNKPWKQSEQMTDESIYQELICESFVKLMGYFHLIGLTSKTLFSIYFKKNLVNRFRIESKY